MSSVAEMQSIILLLIGYQRCSPKVQWCPDLTLFFNLAGAERQSDVVPGWCFPGLTACNCQQALLPSYGLRTCFCSLHHSGNTNKVSSSHSTMLWLFGQAAPLCWVYGWLQPAGKRKSALNRCQVGGDFWAIPKSRKITGGPAASVSLLLYHRETWNKIHSIKLGFHLLSMKE